MKAIARRFGLECALIVLVSSVSCCDDNEHVDEHIDDGKVCLSQSDSDVLKVKVLMEGCYSGSCSEFVSASCSVERQGALIRIASASRVKVSGGTCTDDCVWYGGSSCTLNSVPPGEYRLQHGDFEGTVTIPLPDGKWSEENANRIATCDN